MQRPHLAGAWEVAQDRDGCFNLQIGGPFSWNLGPMAYDFYFVKPFVKRLSPTGAICNACPQTWLDGFQPAGLSQPAASSNVRGILASAARAIAVAFDSRRWQGHNVCLDQLPCSVNVPRQTSLWHPQCLAILLSKLVV